MVNLVSQLVVGVNLLLNEDLQHHSLLWEPHAIYAVSTQEYLSRLIPIM